MNKNIKLAVAGAVLALSATAANAGIIIPAGEWTVDIGGNVNMYTSWAKSTSGSNNTITGGLAGGGNQNTTNKFGNGLLPNFLSVSGSTRQNDLDVSFTISLQPGSAQVRALNQVGSDDTNNGGLNNRQSFITFGDKSWGSVKIGKDLGIFASDAILNDITLLGVGGAYAGAAGNTSLGRIGSGYIYADWKPQIAYTTPNYNGLQATVGISQAFYASGNLSPTYVGNAWTYNNAGEANANVAYEGKASYAFNANGVDGKIWVSGIAQHVGALNVTATGNNIYSGAYGHTTNDDPTAYAADIGMNVKVSGFDFTGYFYGGSGIGTTGQFLNGYGANLTSQAAAARDSYGGYVQAKYTLPTKTIAALSWGESRLDLADGETSLVSQSGELVKSNEQWNAMLIQPLTKHLNLVAEYSNQQAENHRGQKNERNVGSLGAILFF